MTLTKDAELQQGKYVIRRALDTGDRSTTYLATHTYLQETVRLRTIQPPEDLPLEPIHRRFLELGRRLYACRHPHLVRVLDSFIEDNQPFLVLEQPEGQTLVEAIVHQPLPQADALRCIHQVGSALATLHRHGLPHGAISPSAIVLRPGQPPSALLMGMNLSATAPETAGYPSPAQDLRDLALVLYAALTGQPSPAAPEIVPLLHTLHRQQPPISPVVEQALIKALQPDDHPVFTGVEHWLSMLPQVLSAPSLPVAPAPDLPLPAVDPAAAHPADADLQEDKAAAIAPGTGVALDSTPAADIPDPPANSTAEASALSASDAASIAASMTPDTTALTQVVAPAGDLAPPPADPGETTQMVAARPTPAPPSSRSKGRSPQKSTPWFPVAVGLTSVVAALGGLGFGFSLRLDGAEGSRDSGAIIERPQAFPRSETWPGRGLTDDEAAEFLFESPTWSPSASDPGSYDIDRGVREYIGPGDVEPIPPIQSYSDSYDYGYSAPPPAPVEENQFPEAAVDAPLGGPSPEQAVDPGVPSAEPAPLPPKIEMPAPDPVLPDPGLTLPAPSNESGIVPGPDPTPL
jgi:hypothetical protein